MEYEEIKVGHRVRIDDPIYAKYGAKYVRMTGVVTYIGSVYGKDALLVKIDDPEVSGGGPNGEWSVRKEQCAEILSWIDEPTDLPDFAVESTQSRKKGWEPDTFDMEKVRDIKGFIRG